MYNALLSGTWIIEALKHQSVDTFKRSCSFIQKIFSQKKTHSAIWDQCISQKYSISTIYWNKIVCHLLTVCVPCAEVFD
jgi:hypothetical protein